MAGDESRAEARRLLDDAEKALNLFDEHELAAKSTARAQIALAASILAHAETLADRGQHPDADHSAA